MKALLKKGGNIFPESQRINKADVIPTVQWLEKITKLKLSDKLLGTTGKNDTSGDLDIGVDENESSKDALVSRLHKWAMDNQIPKEKVFNTAKTKREVPFKQGWIYRTGTIVHFKTPIAGDLKNGFVQTDFMFTPDWEWTRYSMQATPETDSPFKGADKHIFLSRLTKLSDPARLMSWSYLNGLLDSETREVITKNPDEIAKTVLGPKATRETLLSVERILGYIKDNGLLEKFAPAIEEFRILKDMKSI